MNDLQKYLNRELKGAIRSVTVGQGKAKDSGNTYYYIQLSFVNGYDKRIFLNSEESFAWCNAFEQLETEQQISAEF